jgi:hypothetical protein
MRKLRDNIFRQLTSHVTGCQAPHVALDLSVEKLYDVA